MTTQRAPGIWGRKISFCENFAVQKKQHPGFWHAHITNASATIIMITKNHLSQIFRYWGGGERRRGSYYFQLPVLRTGRTRGSREEDHDANYSEVRSLL